jgi:hypothetical protein
LKIWIFILILIHKPINLQHRPIFFWRETAFKIIEHMQQIHNQNFLFAAPYKWSWSRIKLLPLVAHKLCSRNQSRPQALHERHHLYPIHTNITFSSKVIDVNESRDNKCMRILMRRLGFQKLWFLRVKQFSPRVMEPIVLTVPYSACTVFLLTREGAL